MEAILSYNVEILFQNCAYYKKTTRGEKVLCFLFYLT